MPKKAKNSLMITPLSEFYRCAGDDGFRYYPVSASSRVTAINYNGGDLPPTVKGFAVYDTTISTEYAVALYSSEAEAGKHNPVAAPVAPVHAFQEEIEIVEDSVESEDENDDSDFD